MKYGSGQLILPAIYGAIHRKKLEHKVPEELLLYLQEITTLNRERNIEILKQIKFISTLFINNNIKFVFLKGAAMLIFKPYNSIDERMVGDIDILIDKNDIDRAKDVLLQNNFYTKKTHELKFINVVKANFLRHLQRLIHSDFIAAVELHTEILDFKYANILPAKLILKDIVNHKGYSIPNRDILWKHAILNWQYNDKGLIYNDISFRTFLDVIYLEPEEIDYNKINENAISRFYSLCSIFTNKYQNINNFYSAIFRYKLIYPKFEYFNICITKLAITLKLFFNRLKLMFKSKNYSQIIFRNPRLLIKKIFVFLERR